MMERFCQQFSAIQTAAVDLCLRKPIKKEKYIIFGVYKNWLLKHINILKCVYYFLFILQTWQNWQWGHAEEFLVLMLKHYMSTLAMFSEKSLTCGQRLPILLQQRVNQEVQLHRSLFPIPIKDSATVWWCYILFPNQPVRESMRNRIVKWYW